MAAEALEKSVLESKDKEQLFAIAQALGIKTTARAAKATLIDKILEMTSSGDEPSGQLALAPVEEAAAPATAPKARAASSEPAAATAAPSADDREVVLGPDGEPLADWEIDLIRSGEAPAEPVRSAPVRSTQVRSTPAAPARSAPAVSTSNGSSPDGDGDDEVDGDGDGEDDGQSGDGESRNSRRRRRRRNKNGRPDAAPGTDRPDAPHGDRPPERSNEHVPERAAGQNGTAAANGSVERNDAEQPYGLDSIEVAGHLDLRDEGYGFLRVNGYLSSRDDAYIPVKLTRQYGLRKGDHVTGLSRPAGRNEKNPALLEVHTVNGGDPDLARSRPRFEDLTALFPAEKLRLENTSAPLDMTGRIIDLIAPIGKGQRGVIVSPPKAGKTTIIKSIATSIEKNHPEVTLIVLLIDERPEEVTDMRRAIAGEVISSTFDRPSEEHTHVAELALEKAKRLVENGDDVVMIVDGITRLSRAYNVSVPPSGRILPGGIDAGALYPAKRFFGAARNVEEGGSLTILATALVDTNSRMDDAIFEEFASTGNMELRLDRHLAERRIYPAIDVDASGTRHEELLFDPEQLQTVWKLRRALSGLASDGDAAPGLELLVDRLTTYSTNDEFLDTVAAQDSI